MVDWNPDSFAFVTALLVNFVDNMGLSFTAPVMVPYGRLMGADLQTIALFNTVRGIAAMVSNVWMPRVSDLQGRKLVVTLSLVGSLIAYFVQGFAGTFIDEPQSYADSDKDKKLADSYNDKDWDKDRRLANQPDNQSVNHAIIVFLIGRGVSGFFSGTMPVVRAYVAEISHYDMSLLKLRMTILLVSNQAAGIALSPTAGALGTFGLSLPFYVCAAVAVVGLMWALCFFQEASKLRASATDIEQIGTQSTGKSKDIASKSAGTHELGESDTKEIPKRANPWCDTVVMLVFIGYVNVFMAVAGLQILIPLMLEDYSFGLWGKTKEETLGNVSQAFGLISMPQGVCNTITSLMFFIPVTRIFGDVKTIVAAGTLATLNFIAYGWSSKLWHLCINQAITGICFGFLVPALGPMMAKYASAHYPFQAAEVQAIPILGMQLSLAFGGNILVWVSTQFGMKLAWAACGIFNLIFVILFAVSYQIVDARHPKSSLLTVEQEQFALKLGGEDVDTFIDAACDELRALLKENKENLWNRPVQFLVRQRISGAVPEIRPWDDSSSGREYLEDLGSLLRPFPDEHANYVSKVPRLHQAQWMRHPHLDPAGAAIVMMRAHSNAKRVHAKRANKGVGMAHLEVEPIGCVNPSESESDTEIIKVVTEPSQPERRGPRAVAPTPQAPAGAPTHRGFAKRLSHMALNPAGIFTEREKSDKE